MDDFLWSTIASPPSPRAQDKLYRASQAERKSNQKKYSLARCYPRYYAQKENSGQSIRLFPLLARIKEVTIPTAKRAQSVPSPSRESLWREIIARTLHCFQFSQLPSLVKSQFLDFQSTRGLKLMFASADAQILYQFITWPIQFV